ncbi:MAG: hypothetical protein HYZ44_09825 [Bacteroidetes bacterium]|nr:hypothetical protein [Bacteroidota bacterium]
MLFELPPSAPWPWWRKIVFRFFFIYLLLQIAPWTWFDIIPGVSSVTRYYYLGMDWLVEFANKHFFHVREVLVPLNGSGDTSYGWTQVWLFLSLALIGCVLWSIADRKRSQYAIADYWLRTAVRYFIAMTCLSYGIIKIFALQMSFPNLSQLATPLGDYLPMRLSWMFIGYSTPYQVFSGVMETIAGLLLLNRRTVTLGVMMAAGVFTNVAMMNLAYDIPVKIFSLHLLFYCLFLMAYDYKRIASFFLLNKPADLTSLYEMHITTKWMRIARVVGKSILVILIVILPFYNSWEYYQSNQTGADTKPISSGVYDVISFERNGIPTSPLPGDTLTWKDVIFEKSKSGSVNTTDSLFRQRYRRGYFNYRADTAAKALHVFKRSVQGDSTFLFTINYQLRNDTIFLQGKIRNEDHRIKLVKSKRHFQLAERQFHWLSEYNR